MPCSPRPPLTPPPFPRWWESVDLIRKLVLTGVITFIEPGTTTQLFIAVLLTQLFIVAYARFRPYYHDEDDDLQLLSQLQIWFTALSGLAVKFSGLSIDAAKTNTYESGAFDVIMVVTSAAPLCMTVVLLLLKIRRQFKEMYVVDLAGAMPHVPHGSFSKHHGGAESSVVDNAASKILV